MAIIYSISDPRDGKVQYIGKSTRNIAYRLASHMIAKKGTPVSDWIKSLMDDGVIPLIEEIEVVERMHLDISEEYWINQFITWGFNLLNRCYNSDQYKLAYKPLRKGHKWREKKVVQRNMDKSFVAIHNSISDAAKSIKRSHSTVSNVVNGREEHAAGFIFEFEENS